MYSSLLSQLLTVQDLAELKLELEALLASLYRLDDAALTQALRTQVRREVATILSAELHHSGEEQKKKLEQLRDELASFEIVHLDLAISPSQELLENIVTWLRRNVMEQLVVSLSIRPALIGGAKISWQGKFGDYSLQKKLDAYLPQQEIFTQKKHDKI